MIKLKKDKEIEIVEWVKTHFQELYNTRLLIDELVEENIYKYNFLYEEFKPEDERNEFNYENEYEKWKSKITVPVIFTQVKTIRPRIIASLFNSPDYIDISCDDINISPFLPNIRQYLLSKLNKARFREKVKLAVSDALIYPCGWLKMTLNSHNEPQLYRIPYYNVWTSLIYNPSIGLPEVYHRTETDLNTLYLQEKNGVYHNIENVKDVAFPTDISNFEKRLFGYHLGLSSIEVAKISKRPASYKPIEILEWWGKFDINDDGIDEDIVVTLANREVCIRIDLNPYKFIPFFPIRLIKEENLIYGKTLAQLLNTFQEELSFNRRARLDFSSLVINPPLKIRRTADIDLATLFLAPGHLIEVDERDDVDFFTIGNIQPTMLTDDALINQDIQAVSGVSDVLRGISPSRQTATGLSILTSESATRLRDYVMDIAEDLVNIIQKFALWLKKYKKDDDAIIMRYNAQKWKEIPEEYLENFDFKINISNIMFNKDLRLQLLLNLLNVIGRLPNVNIYPLIEQILDLADIKNIDQIIKPLSESEVSRRVVAKRNIETERKRQKELIKQERATQEIIRNTGGGMLPTPIVPTLQNIITNPFIELIKNLGGKL
ncbi:MAG: hypothetical protein QW474_01620 [Candidatus Aenigmatarchaeota archaeon]